MGNRKGEWAIDIHKNFRMENYLFAFEQSEFIGVKVEDYHSEELMEKYPKKRSTRKPSHPGEILKNLWLLMRLGYSQSHFAESASRGIEGIVKKINNAN